MFQHIKKIQNTSERKFFIEKIELFVKLINAFALKNKLVDELVDSDVSDDTRKRLIELQIIESNSADEQNRLREVLKIPLYIEFIKAVNFNIKFKKLIGNLLNNLDPSKRKKAQLKSIKSSDPKIIDFFCGAGGLSLGFNQEGFQVGLANDYDEVCIESFRYNHPEVPEERVILGDIRNIVNHIEDYIFYDVDVVIGGPPCQGFSSANQQRIIDDPRNELYKYFLKAISKIAPKFVIMENVKGMLPYAQQIIEDYNLLIIEKENKNFSYSVGCKVLVSSDFGVAQKRQRLFFIAVRSDISEQKKISPDTIFNEIEDSLKSKKLHVLKDALEFIKPLNAPRIKNMTEADDELTGKKVDLNQFKGNENSYLKMINGGRKIDYIFNHKARYTNDINFQIYSILDQGEDGTSEKIKHIMPYGHRNHIFKDKYFKLSEDKPSRTITAHLKMDCHSHIHPRQVRSITQEKPPEFNLFLMIIFF